jgi:NAD(P)H-hydrate epimerase
MKKFVPAEADNFVVMSRSEVRTFDAWAINELGIPGTVLMENAGRSCAELVIARLADIDRPKVCIFCGIGNNGGDGYVIARHLNNAQIEARIVICGGKAKIKGDALINLQIIEGINLPIDLMDMAESQIAEQVKSFAAGCDVLVDALFGTGLKGDLRDGYALLIDRINVQNLPIVAVDIPSGLDCDTGSALGTAVKAAATVTFAAVKKGFVVCPDAANYTGEIYVASIGVEPTILYSSRRR